MEWPTSSPYQVQMTVGGKEKRRGTDALCIHFTWKVVERPVVEIIRKDSPCP